MADFRSIDAAFTQAVESKAMPGIVAMAANDKGVIYEGAFGKRDLSTNTPMTRDSVVWIASMTKAITAAAAMQLVEQGKLSLEQPASATVPELGSAQVLEGFDAGGKPILRPPKRPITLRHLLTHTAGFSYEIWRPEIARYQTATGTPGITTCTNAALTTRRPPALGRQVPGTACRARPGSPRPARSPAPPGCLRTAQASAAPRSAR